MDETLLGVIAGIAGMLGAVVVAGALYLRRAPRREPPAPPATSLHRWEQERDAQAARRTELEHRLEPLRRAEEAATADERTEARAQAAGKRERL